MERRQWTGDATLVTVLRIQDCRRLELMMSNMHEKMRDLAIVGRDAGRDVGFARAAAVLCLLACLTVGARESWAQRADDSASGTNAAPLFVPSRDLHSPNYYSAVDAARKDRPPEPTKVREDLFYPDGFLTLSTPTPPPQSPEKPKKSESEPEKTQKRVDRGDPIRPLDPSVETTPLTVEPRVKTEETEEPARRSRKDRFFFFAVSVALAGLGIFVYNDFRYRDQLRADLVKNAKLCSPTATPADFAEVLAEDVDLTDPRAPSYVNPHYDADVVLYADPDKAGKILSDPAFDDYRFEVSNSPRSHFGPGLGDENFDFAPSEDGADVLGEEEEEDFDVSLHGSATGSQSAVMPNGSI